ncbi:MAG TPA: DegT/DnrJ/EryC1/StrS family aminotransferase [Thermoleophilia bacterium]|nr:DegT/DnrJ/EryC1/StrS family aminotransferase [Thermoleophilia bacterium]
MTDRTPALLGGAPAFPDGLPLLRPSLPDPGTVLPGIHDALASGMLTKGSALRRYEAKVADHLGVEHVVAVSSCTAGLMLVFQAIAEANGVRPAPAAVGPDGAAATATVARPRALMPSFTFMATAMAAVWAGLEPVFCDIDPLTWNLSPAGVEAVLADPDLGFGAALLVPVHIFGNPADTAAFERLGREHGLAVVYDAAHGFGALNEGHPVGREGYAQCFSTSPTKLQITAEGGIVATGDEALAERLVAGRDYGNPGDYDALFCGLNARLSELHALLGIAGLDVLEAEAVARNELAAHYRELLGEVPGVTFQHIADGDRSSYKDVSVRIGGAFALTRDQLAAALKAEGVDTRAYYVPPVHRMRAFGAFTERYEPLLPETAALCDEVLTLPCYGSMTAADVAAVAAAIAAAHERGAEIRAALGA